MTLRSMSLLAVVSAFVSACGSSAPPSESEIWHAATLRPGVELATTPGEEQLLQRIASLPADEPVRLGEQVFTPGAPYHAASGRTCRSVGIQSGESARNRLVCDDAEGRWVFVPNPFPAGSP